MISKAFVSISPLKLKNTLSLHLELKEEEEEEEEGLWMPNDFSWSY